MNKKKLIKILIALTTVFIFAFLRKYSFETAPSSVYKIAEAGHYQSKEEVVAYLRQYNHLPNNYVTKKEAQAQGWIPSEGNLREVLPGASIGGDRFANREGKLPDKNGRKWYECDIDYHGGKRNAKRLVYSNDGLFYYSDDHYQSFKEVKGAE